MAVLNEQNFQGLLQIHNVQNPGDCSLKENRFLDNDSGFFCWRGIVSQSDGDCITADICSDVSFIDARDKFCASYGGRKFDPRYPPGNPTCLLDQYVPNLPGMDPTIHNVRGGSVTYEPHDQCQGLNGMLHCLGSGIHASLSGDKNTLMKNTAIAVGGLFVIALAVRYTKLKGYIPKGILNTRGLVRTTRKNQK